MGAERDPTAIYGAHRAGFPPSLSGSGSGFEPSEYKVVQGARPGFPIGCGVDLPQARQGEDDVVWIKSGTYDGADRRDAEAQKALFTTDTRFAVYMSGPDTDPTYVLEGRQALTPVFEALNQYQATTHFNGQSTVVLDGERATGESYTIAHHLFTADGERKIMIASLRYLDTFVKIDDTWLFAERNLILDWSETRPSTA